MHFDFILFFLRHYIFLAIFTAFAYLVGARFTRKLSYHSTAEKFSFCTGLGLGVIAYAVLAIGLAGLLSLPIVAGMIGIFSLLFLRSWKDLGFAVIRSWKASAWQHKLFALVVVLLISPVLIHPLFPPTQWDATSYHLAAAKIYIRSHGLVFTDYLRYPVFPQTNEMLFTLSMLLYDDLLAQLVEFLMMVLVASAIYAWGRRAFNARAGVLGAVLWLSNPLVLWLGRTAYVDIGLSMFLLLGGYSFFNWRQTRNIHWLLLSAAMIGFACGTKYLALFPLLGFSTYLLYRAVRDRSVRELLYFGLLAAAVASPWYLRNMYYTGNPIWPFLGSHLGYGNWNAEDLASQLSEQQTFGAGKGVTALLMLPWNVTFHGNLFHHANFTISPVYFFLLPLCVIIAFRSGALRYLLALVGLYTLFWFSSVQVLRYLIPAGAVLSLASAAALDQVVFRFRAGQRAYTGRALTIAICILFLVTGWTWAPPPGVLGISLVPPALPPVTKAERTAYLKNSLIPYAAFDYLNQLRGSGYSVYAIACSNMAYFADGAFVGDWEGPARYPIIVNHITKPEELYLELKKLKIEYLMIDENGSWGDVLPDQLLSTESLDSHLKLIYATSKSLIFEVRDQPVAVAFGPELIRNGGFEESLEEMPAGWTATGKPVYDSTGANSHNGTAAVRSDGYAWYLQRVHVDPGSIYMLRHFSRSEGADGPDGNEQRVRLQIHWLDASGVVIGGEWRVLATAPDWQNHAMAVMAPPGAVQAEVYASVHDVSTIWLDDVSLVRVEYR